MLNLNLPRDFKGIWIPKEIWENEAISPMGKLVFAGIQTLSDLSEEAGVCNDHLRQLLGISSRTLRLHTSLLKKIGLIVEKSFDGRVKKWACIYTVLAERI
jgi:DNA-binding transcriptional ArsR family regulator